MPSLKDIRKRIVTVKSTQKITRAMKMVAGARLNRAQRRITELRPYAVKTQEVLGEVIAQGRKAIEEAELRGEIAEGPQDARAKSWRRLLDSRAGDRALVVVLTSDRGLCGSFNTNICKLAEHEWRRRAAEGHEVQLLVIGRKGRDYFRRRGGPMDYVQGVWDRLDWEGSRALAGRILEPYLRQKGGIDRVLLVYNEFKSAMTQKVTAEQLLPIVETTAADDSDLIDEFIFEPSIEALLEQLVPMYLQVSILRAMLESMASELGARMTAMDAATNNASEMIGALTLQYNRARQAAITKELMEIIGGSEALKG
jgi:F-type H+-transporting ATPase subunit gamma